MAKKSSKSKTREPYKSEPFEGYLETFKPETMTNAEYKNYMASDPYKPREAKSYANEIRTALKKQAYQDAMSNFFNKYKEKHGIGYSVKPEDFTGRYDRSSKNYAQSKLSQQEDMTDYWRDRTAHTAGGGGGQPEEDYATVYMQKHLNQGAQRAAYYLNKLKEAKQQQAVQSAKDARSKGIAADAATGKLKTNAGGLWSGTTDEYKEATKAGNQAANREAIDRMKSQGVFDQQDDISLWSAEARKGAKGAYLSNIKNEEKEIERLKALISGMTPNITDRERTEALIDAYITPEIEEAQKIINGDEYSEEEKNKARRELQRLRQKANYGAQQFLGSGFLAYMDDESRIDYVRKELYDSLYGRGEYDKATAGLSTAEKDELNRRLDDAMDNATNAYGQAGKDLRTHQKLL